MFDRVTLLSLSSTPKLTLNITLDTLKKAANAIVYSIVESGIRQASLVLIFKTGVTIVHKSA